MLMILLFCVNDNTFMDAFRFVLAFFIEAICWLDKLGNIFL